MAWDMANLLMQYKEKFEAFRSTISFPNILVSTIFREKEEGGEEITIVEGSD